VTTLPPAAVGRGNAVRAAVVAAAAHVAGDDLRLDAAPGVLSVLGWVEVHEAGPLPAAAPAAPVPIADAGVSAGREAGGGAPPPPPRSSPAADTAAATGGAAAAAGPPDGAVGVLAVDVPTAVRSAGGGSSLRRGEGSAVVDAAAALHAPPPPSSPPLPPQSAGGAVAAGASALDGPPEASSAGPPDEAPSAGARVAFPSFPAGVTRSVSPDVAGRRVASACFLVGSAAAADASAPPPDPERVAALASLHAAVTAWEGDLGGRRQVGLPLRHDHNVKHIGGLCGGVGHPPAVGPAAGRRAGGHRR